MGGRLMSAPPDDQAARSFLSTLRENGNRRPAVDKMRNNIEVRVILPAPWDDDSTLLSTSCSMGSRIHDCEVCCDIIACLSSLTCGDPRRSRQQGE